MKILLTGGAGFIGSHLAERLMADGHQITVIDDLSTGRYENIAPFIGKPGFRFIVDSILNTATLEPLILEHELVYHLAASVGVKRIVERPVETIETNVLGTHAVLSLAAKYNRKVVVFSTSEVYGKNPDPPYTEDNDCVFGTTMKSRWSYGCTKALDEFLALAYHKEQGLPVIVVRVFNMIGPRQSGRYGMVVPNFVRQALRNKPITVFGTGDQSRCFTYVGDLVEALLRLSAEPRSVGEIFNVGSTEEITITALAEKIKSKTKSTSAIVRIPYEEAYEEGFEDMFRRVPDVSKLKTLTGFTPLTKLDAALDRIVEFESVRVHEAL
jgi:UDP-glucose 4-epimerase